MEYTPKELCGNTEDVTGRKKSRFKFLKVRLFGRLKKKETEGQMKESQSTGDVTTQEGERGEDDSEDDCQYPKGTLSSRALSHDSIFLADPVQSSQPTRVLSQENVHTKIKALQLKLQQQNMRLAPPLLIPGRRIEDSGTTSEDDGLPRSPPEMSFQEVVMQRGASKYPETKSQLSLLSLAGTGSEEEEQGGFSQPSSRPLSPVPQLYLSEPSFAGVDFTRPAEYIPTLDNSAARHRMSIKPKNQRAVTKIKKNPTLYRPRSSSMNNLDQMHSQTMHYYSFDSEDLTQAEEFVSLPTSTHLQIEPENVTQLSGSQWSPLNTHNKAAKLSQNEDKTKTSSSVSFDEIPVLHASDHTMEPLTKEPSLIPLDISSEDISCGYTVIKEGNDDDRQIEPLKTSIDLGVSKPAGIQTKPHPVPAPRIKRAIVNNCPPKVFGLKPVEKETASSLGLSESPKEDESVRPSPFRFNIAPAKYRSKTSDENVYKQDEESSGNAQKSQAYNQNPVVQMEKVENPKSTEVCGNTPSASDKRSSLQKDVVAQSVSKTGVVDNSEKSEGPQNTQYLKSEKAEESQDKRGLFGVKLRSTSLCLKYRSELPKLDAEIKRHSLEGHLIQAVKEQVSCDLEQDKKGNVQESFVPESLDLQQDLDKGSEKDKKSGPAWRSQARVHQSFPTKPPTQPTSPTNPTTSLSTPQSPSTQLPKPPLQSRPKIPTTSKPQPASPSSQPVPPRTAPRAIERWTMSHQKEEKCFVKQSTHKDELSDYKVQSKPAAKANIQTDQPEQQPSSDRTEPTWMELAKRKSLAWSDKTLDSVNF